MATSKSIIIVVFMVATTFAFDPCPMNFTCYRSSNGGCHTRDGMQNCTESFTFDGVQDDICILNSATGEVICKYAFFDSGQVIHCKNATTDCPQRLDGTLCNLVPSGGGEWCVALGAQCTLSAEQVRHCGNEVGCQDKVYGECGKDIVPGRVIECCGGMECNPAQNGAPPVCLPQS